MDKQQAWYNLVLIVHFVGDMHCPEHMRFNPEDMTIGYYNVKLMGQEERYHTIWDGNVISVKWPWSFGDVAKLFDSFTDEEIEQVVTGDVYTWGEDAARSSWPIHQIKEGAVLKKKWLREQMPLVQKQIRNAGYRLAHILNMTFDTKYAKKYIVKQK